MRIRKDKCAQTKQRGITRWIVDAKVEHKRGLTAQRAFRVDDTGNIFPTRTAAENFIRVLQSRIGAGTGGVDAEKKTFGDAFVAWEQAIDEKVAFGVIAQTTACDDVQLARNHILNRWTLRGVQIGDVRLHSIDYCLLRNELVRSRNCSGKTVRGQLHTTGLSRRSVVKLCQRLRKIFDAAIEEGWISANPAALLRVPFPAKDPADKALDPRIYRGFAEDQAEFFAALERVAPEFVLPLQTIRRTGIRIGELRALSLDQIEVGERVTRIKIDRAWKAGDSEIGKPKNGRTRWVALDVATGRELIAHAVEHGRRGSACLFGVGDRPLYEPAVRLAWYQAQFATRGWLFYRGSDGGDRPTATSTDSRRNYRLIKLSKPISEFTVDEFASLRYGQLGRAKGGGRQDGQLFGSIEDAAAYASLTLFGLHDLRHLFASVLFDAGISLRQCAQRIGDTEETTRRHYVHWLAADDESDLEAIAAIG